MVVAIKASWFSSVIVAFQFLTRLPLPVHVDYNEQTVSRSLYVYPLVGMVIGGMAFLPVWLLPAGAEPLQAALMLMVWAAVTGGLHLDGLMDTADGLGSHRSKEQMLVIMKDSRVGAMGVLAAVFVLLLKWTALWVLLSQLHEASLLFVLLLVPAMSRWWMSIAIVAWPYIGGPNGMGSLFRHATGRAVAVSALFVACSLLLLPEAIWLVIPVIQAAAGLLVTRHISKQLGGLTGDTYGALNELLEMSGLVVAAYVAGGGI